MNDFDHRQALDLLLTRLAEEVPDLRKIVMSEIDAGKEVSDGGVGSARGPRGISLKKLSDEEALAVALSVLRSYFIELPKLMESARENFQLAAVANGRRIHREMLWDRSPDNDSLVDIDFEQRTAARFSEGEECWRMNPPDAELVAAQTNNLDRLFRILTGRGLYDGDTE